MKERGGPGGGRLVRRGRQPKKLVPESQPWLNPEQGFGHVASYPGEHSVTQTQAGPMQWLQNVRLGWSSIILAQMAPGTLAHIVLWPGGLKVRWVLLTARDLRECLSQI